MKLKIYNENLTICGCDEAGRGALAGPVFAAAVILPKNFQHPLLNDSKKVSKKNRLILKEFIQKNCICFGVGKISPKKIDQINILNSSIGAMHKAIRKIVKKIDLILVDGNKFKKYKNLKHKCIIKGDGKYISIASASILAKTYRDDYMNKLHGKSPVFNWRKNKGYPTKEHKKEIKKHGLTIYHRHTFKSS